MSTCNGLTATDKVLDSHVYKPVGVCIYCGAIDNLTNEHILPFGLSGSSILPKSSCQQCAAITGKVEQDILRGSFWPVRVFRDLKSRSKHKDAPAQIEVSITRNNNEEVISLNIDEAPILLPFPIYPLPAHCRSKESMRGILVSGHHTIRFGSDPLEVTRRWGGSKIDINVQLKPVDFARMIAKVGYAFAYAEGEIAHIEGCSFVLPAILGKCDEIGRWVGNIPNKPIAVFPNHLHRILLHRDAEMGFLFAEVQLFSDSETPSYVVVLGKLKA